MKKIKPVKAWGVNDDGKLRAWANASRLVTKFYAGPKKVIRVEIRPVERKNKC